MKRNLLKNFKVKFITILITFIILIFSFNFIYDYYSFNIDCFIANNAYNGYLKNGNKKLLRIAEKHYNEAYDNLVNKQEKNVDNNKSIILFNLANLYSEKGMFNNAESLYKRNLIIREKLYGKNHISIANVYNGLGQVYFKKNQFLKAENYFLLGLNIVENSNLRKKNNKIYSSQNINSIYSCILRNLISVYIKQKKYDQAKQICYKSMKFYESQQMKYEYGFVIARLGYINELTLDYLSAEKNYKKSANLLKGISDETRKIVLSDLKNLYEKQNRKKEINYTNLKK